MEWFAEHLGDNASCWHCYHPEETAAVMITLDCTQPERAARVDSPARRALLRWGREEGVGERVVARLHAPRGTGRPGGGMKDSTAKKRHKPSHKRVHHEL